MHFRTPLTAALCSLVSISNAWDAPSLVSPANGSLTFIATAVNWNSVLLSEAYQLQVDTTPNFNSGLLYAVTEPYINSAGGNSDTDEGLSGLRFNTTYHWRVRAFVTGDTSAWSPVRTFITRDQVITTSPANGSLTWTAMAMQWEAFWGVAFYDAELDTTPAFNSPQLRQLTTTYINANNGNADTEWGTDDLLFGTAHYWRVRVRSADDTSAWSTPRNFLTRDAVILTSPANASLTWTGMTMNWEASWGCDFYDVQLDTAASFNSPVLRSLTTTYIDANNGNLDTEWFTDDLYFGATYHWRVRARNSVDTSGWGSSRTFITRDFVTLVSPANLALNVSTVGATLNWNAHWAIDAYELELDTVNQFNSTLLVANTSAYINANDGNSDTQFFTGPLLTDQVYFWRVRAVNAVDTSAWTVRAFNTGSGAILLPEVPLLVAPADNAVVVNATEQLVWQAAANATAYQYAYAADPNFTNAVAGTTADTQVPTGALVIGTTYWWRVRGLSGGNASDWSTVWNFTYDPLTAVGEELPRPGSLWPNPATDMVQIGWPEAQRVLILDASGRPVRDRLLTGRSVLQRDGLPAGVYTMVLFDKDGRVVANSRLIWMER